MKKLSFRGWKVAFICGFISVAGLCGGFYGTQKVMAVTKSRFENLELFNKVLYLVENQYYRELSTEKLIQGAINGLMETLDPHSAYLNKEVFQKVKEDTQGEFGGLGIEVSQRDGVLVVVTPIDDTPAFEAGIQSGDKIVEINHKSTIGLSLEEAVDKMRGEPGTTVLLGVAREGVDEIKQIKVKREIIKVQAAKSQIIKDNFAYVRLIQFQKDSGTMIKKHLQRMEKKLKKRDKNLRGIVLDLRSNPGGLLDEAVNVSSLFLEDGVVVSTEGRDPKNKDVYYVKKEGDKYLKTPLVILINGASASASEIVAGAIQDHDRGIIMGSQSFGKGSVQTIAKIDQSQGVKLTVAQYMTPDDRKIQAVGIKPDVELSEFEGRWVEEHKKEEQFVREADLRNHIRATIETPEEKKRRLEKEKERRQQRIKRYKEKQKQKEETSQDLPRKRKPEEDYQVIQAVKYLKTYEIFQEMDKAE